MLRSLSFLFMMLFGATALAGDAADFLPLGFSKDGTYYAFAQTGVQDGSGFPYAQVAVVNVAKNSFAASRSVVLEDIDGSRGLTPEHALNKALSQVNLGRFGIRRGQNLGRDLLLRLDTDFSSYSQTLFSYDFWAEGGASLTIPKYELLVETVDGEDTTEGQWCTELLGERPQMLKLTLQGREGTDETRLVLQEDRRLPRSRSCVNAYSVRRVTEFRGALVVAVSFTTPGFEGPDVRHMVVTGRFNPSR
jgi:predicted secreted protein